MHLKSKIIDAEIIHSTIEGLCPEYTFHLTFTIICGIYYKVIRLKIGNYAFYSGLLYIIEFGGTEREYEKTYSHTVDFTLIHLHWL